MRLLFGQASLFWIICQSLHAGNGSAWITRRDPMILVLVPPGCSKITQDDFDKTSAGMSCDEVTRLIGLPDKCDEVMGLRNCLWGDEKRSINVSLVAGQVLLFSSNNLR